MDEAKHSRNLTVSASDWKTGFRNYATASFSFLLKQGFSSEIVEDFHIRYKSQDVTFDLYFETYSNEISAQFSIGDSFNERFELADYRRWALLNGQPDFPIVPCIPERSADGLNKLLDEFATVVKNRSAPLLIGDRSVYDAMDQLRLEYQKIEREKAALHRIRVAGEAFWKDHDLRGVIETYNKIEDKLLPSEQMKLEYARKHLG
jgi:hypothetical protein